MVAARSVLTARKQGPSTLPRRLRATRDASVTLSREPDGTQRSRHTRRGDAAEPRQDGDSPDARADPAATQRAWSSREVFGFLVWRDIKVRYAQTALGAVWIDVQPLAMMLVYTFAFSHIAKVVIPGTPYPVFALAGLTMWIFVSRGLSSAPEPDDEHAARHEDVVPRILIPIAAVVSVFVGLRDRVRPLPDHHRCLRDYPTWRMAFVPLLLPSAFILTLGLALLFSATSVRYRDVGQALPFLVQLWFFLSPIAYLLQTPGHSWETVIQALNPLVGLILAFRWA